MSDKSDNTNITYILKNARLSFPHLFTPQAGDDGGKPRYTCTLILKGNDPQVVEVRNILKKLAAAKWPKRVPSTLRQCLRDAGDRAEKFDGYEEGDYYISCARAESMGAPLTINKDKSEIMADDGTLYAGCYVNAKLSFYAMEHSKGGPQVNANVEVVQFWKDGESFGGGRPNADDMPDGDSGSTDEDPNA